MKTSYYTFTTWDDGAMAAGFDSGLKEGRQAAVPIQPARTVRDKDKVIDLNTWRADNLDVAGEEPQDFGWEYGGDQWEPGGPASPAPRPRRSRRSMFTAELVSTLSVVAAAVALIVRVLTF